MAFALNRFGIRELIERVRSEDVIVGVAGHSQRTAAESYVSVDHKLSVVPGRIQGDGATESGRCDVQDTIVGQRDCASVGSGALYGHGCTARTGADVQRS